MKSKLTTRTHYSVKNATVAMATKILAIVFGYFARMVLTRVIAIEYVGLNGLLMNILGALNVFDLGIGTALVYSLYKPVAAHDEAKQNLYLELYKKIYFWIAALVTVICLLMYPIMRVLLFKKFTVEHLFLIYLVFTARTVSSYFLMYRSIIFLANQRNYVNDLIDSILLILQNVIQIVLLVSTKSFYLFISIGLFTLLLRNCLIYWFAGVEYPFICRKPVGKLGKEEKESVYKNVKAILMHKIGTVIINNIDNLTLTSVVGIIAVGLYSNYYLIIGSISQIIGRIIYGISGSVGNLGTTEDKNHVKEVFLGTFLLVAIGYGTASIVLSEMLDVFVEASFGTEYVFPRLVTVVLCVNFFLNGLRQASLIFRDSLGLFWHDRYKTIIESLVNLVFSIILAKKMGAAGVFIGTFISIVGVSMWVEPIVLYRDYFKSPVSEYFKKLFKYVFLYGCSFLLVNYLNQMIPWENDIIQYFGMICVSSAVSLLILGGFNIKTPEMRFVISHLKPLVKKEETL